MTVVTSKGQVYQTPNYSKLRLARLWCGLVLAILWWRMMTIFRRILPLMQQFKCFLVGHRIIPNFHVDVANNVSSSSDFCVRCRKRWDR